MRKIIMLMLIAATVLGARACVGDHSPPSPQEIVLQSNVLKVIGLSDPCKVEKLEILIIKKNETLTALSTAPRAETVNAVVTLNAEPPFTLVVSYADGAGNPGSLTWKIRYLPYIAYTLEQMVVQGTKAVVLVNPPPAKPALPRSIGDVNIQSGAWMVMALLGLSLGAIRYALSRRS